MDRTKEDLLSFRFQLMSVLDHHEKRYQKGSHELEVARILSAGLRKKLYEIEQKLEEKK